MNKKTDEDSGVLEERRITEWLDPDSKCGGTSFENCRTNRGWLVCEMGRLKNKDDRCCIVSHGGKMAIFRLANGEKASDVERKLDEGEKERPCESRT